jgi:hypothetical protein
MRNQLLVLLVLKINEPACFQQQEHHALAMGVEDTVLVKVFQSNDESAWRKDFII